MNHKVGWLLKVNQVSGPRKVPSADFIRWQWQKLGLYSVDLKKEKSSWARAGALVRGSSSIPFWDCLVFSGTWCWRLSHTISLFLAFWACHMCIDHKTIHPTRFNYLQLADASVAGYKKVNWWMATVSSFRLSMSTTTGTSDSKVLGVVLLARHGDREGTLCYTHVSKEPLTSEFSDRFLSKSH